MKQIKSNFKDKAEEFNFSLKLNNLSEDELYYLAKSLDIDSNNEKRILVINIVDKFKSLSNEEFKSMSRTLDDNIKSKELKDEKIDEIDDAQKFNLSDRIFFIFAPKVEPNPKILFYIPLNISIIIIFIINIITVFCLWGNQNYQSDIFVFYFISNLFLFISMVDNVPILAKISLFINEFLFFRDFLKIKWEHYFYKSFLEDLITFIIVYYFFIYLVYLQLISAKIKGNKKNKKEN